jgi:hypothetical protein
MGGTIRVTPAGDAGSSTQSKPVKSTVKAANSPKGAMPRSAVRIPNVNLTNTYGISNQKANTKSAVTGAGTKKPPDNQGTLAKKASRFVC